MEKRRLAARHKRAWIIGGVAAVVVLGALAAITVSALTPGGPVDVLDTAQRSGSPQPTPTDEAMTTTPEPSASAVIPPATPVPSPTVSPTPKPSPRPKFRSDRALHDMRALEAHGVRSGGGSAEKEGAEYIAERLRAAGADAQIRTFKLTNGKTSRNVVARFPGATRETIILGAHMDSKAPSPGANDNASGCAALMEIARCLGEQPAFPTVEIVCFGTEEMIDADPDHHHFGSRFHVKDMSAGARKNAAGMISVDMIGYGPSFVVRSMGQGPQSMVKLLLRQAETARRCACGTCATRVSRGGATTRPSSWPASPPPGSSGATTPCTTPPPTRRGIWSRPRCARPGSWCWRAVRNGRVDAPALAR